MHYVSDVHAGLSSPQMRRITPIALLTVFAVACSAQGADTGEPNGGVKGVVLDATCYGPCVVGDDLEPYTGPGAHVVIRSLPDHSVEARRAPDEGRFKARLQPGRYKVRAYVQDAGGSRLDRCWEGEAKRVRIREDRFRRVRLRVLNSCIR